MTRSGIGVLVAIGIAGFAACSLVNSFDDVKTEPDTSTGGGSNTGTNSNSGTGTGTNTGTGGHGGNCIPVTCDNCDDPYECCERNCSSDQPAIETCICAQCHCDYTCPNPPCKGITCGLILTTGTSCTSECGGPNPCKCTYDAECEFTCVQAPCDVECNYDSKCTLTCGSIPAGQGGSGSCYINKCSKGPVTNCGNGVYACGMYCP